MSTTRMTNRRHQLESAEHSPQSVKHPAWRTGPRGGSMYKRTLQVHNLEQILIVVFFMVLILCYAANRAIFTDNERSTHTFQFKNRVVPDIAPFA